MSRLYLANCTRQNHVVCYRLDYDNGGNLKDINRRFEPAKQQDIPAGRQVQIGSDFHIRQIEDIVDQLSTYGLIGVVDVGRHKANDLKNLRSGVVPYIFNIDKVVPADAIRTVMAYNANILIDDGRLRRQRAAVASNEMVQTAVAHQFLDKGIDATPSKTLDVSFEQEEQTEAGEKTISEGYKVSPDAPRSPPPAPVRNKGGRPRKAAA